MNREIPTPTTEFIAGFNPWTTPNANLHRAATPLEALLQCSPGEEPELSIQELAEIREVLNEAIVTVLSEQELWVFNETVVARTALRKMGVPKTTAARIRDNAIDKLRNHLQEHPVIVAYINRNQRNNIDLLAGKRIFLSGPMRGRPEFNFDSFATARIHLRSFGLDVFCPAEQELADGFNPNFLDGHMDELREHGFDLAEALARNIEQILKRDIVVVLPGWESSTGTRTEMSVAFKHGKKVYTLNNQNNPDGIITRHTTPSSAVLEVRPL